MKKLKRIWARVSILCIVAFVLWFMYSADMPLGWSMLVGAIPVGAFAFIRYRMLRCPYCGNTKGIPEKAIIRWSGKADCRCPKCGHWLEFDDESIMG